MGDGVARKLSRPIYPEGGRQLVPIEIEAKALDAAEVFERQGYWNGHLYHDGDILTIVQERGPLLSLTSAVPSQDGGWCIGSIVVSRQALMSEILGRFGRYNDDICSRRHFLQNHGRA